MIVSHMGLVKFTKTLSITAHLSDLFISVIHTPTNKLAKFLVPILKSLTSDEQRVKGVFAFAKEIIEQDPEFVMGSLEVESFFPKIPIEKTINICTNRHFENAKIVEVLSKTQLKKQNNYLLQNNPILFLMERSTSKSIKLL